MDLALYKIFSLACTVVVLAYVLYSLLDALRQWSVIKRARAHASTRHLKASHSSNPVGAVTRRIEPERAARVFVRNRQSEAA
jgi:hypothetical protein